MSSLGHKLQVLRDFRKTHGVRQLLRTYCALGINRTVSALLHGYNAFLARNFWCWRPARPKSGREAEIIVSLTSYPARIPTLAAVLVPLFRQTMAADRIILTLAKTQFPHGESDLPKRLLALKKRGLEIFWAPEDLRSHKKYFYVMQNHPDANIITVDDDIFYRSDMIGRLWEGHRQSPHAVIAHQVRKIVFYSNNQLAPYSNWEHVNIKCSGYPSFQFLSIGCGGVLYPPNCLAKEYSHREVFMKLCPYADDLWLKIMALLNDTPIVATPDIARPLYALPEQQKGGLADHNYFGGNDEQFAALLEYYNHFQPGKPSLLQRMKGETRSSDASPGQED